MSGCITEADMCPGVQEHNVSSFACGPLSVNFALHRELPLPWKYVLESEKWLLQFLDYCQSPAVLSFSRSHYFHGYERFYLHCHCQKARSLQCLAAAVLISTVYQNFMKGAAFDRRFNFFRSFCNRDMPKHVLYTGSILFKNIHYVYIRIRNDGDFLSLLKSVYFGEHLHVCSQNNYIIIICRKCSPLTTEAAVQCARRIRYILRKCLGVLQRFHSPIYLSPCLKEPRRQKLIWKFVNYGLPIDFRKYCS